MPVILSIKNMVCPRCIKAVGGILDSLGIRYDSISLGQAEICEPLSEQMYSRLGKALEEEGFELLDDRRSSEVESIRLAVIEWVRMEGQRPNISAFLQERFSKEYSSISKLFSQTRSMTVERYALLQRIEYAKELISYGQMSFSEIAWKLGFSSPAHFSSQFKKETGLSPNQFRELGGNKRVSIDQI